MSTANRYLLRYRQGENSPWQELYLSEGEIVVGRALDCGLALDHLEVSRRHASLEVENGDVWLTDLGSSNGTQIGDQPLPPRERAALPPGQRFTIGPYHLEIEKVSHTPSMLKPSTPAAPEAHELGGTLVMLALPGGLRSACCICLISRR
jgi:predicted component of type VI protein secretion system